MTELYLITAKCVCRVFEHNDGNIKEREAACLRPIVSMDSDDWTLTGILIPKGASNAAMHVDLQWGDTQGAP